LLITTDCVANKKDWREPELDFRVRFEQKADDFVVRVSLDAKTPNVRHTEALVIQCFIPIELFTLRSETSVVGKYLRQMS
jgi:hypothetical protein